MVVTVVERRRTSHSSLLFSDFLQSHFVTVLKFMFYSCLYIQVFCTISPRCPVGARLHQKPNGGSIIYRLYYNNQYRFFCIESLLQYSPSTLLKRNRLYCTVSVEVSYMVQYIFYSTYCTNEGCHKRGKFLLT